MKNYNSTLALILIIILVLNYSSYAQIKEVGTSGFTFLEIPVTARQAALGDAFIAMRTKSADATVVNPAGLAYISSQSLMVSYAPWLADTKHESIAYGINLGEIGAIGFSAVLLDMGNIQGSVIDNTNPAGYRITNMFSASAWAMGISYSRRLTDKFSYGVTLKYVKEGFSNVELADGSQADFKATNFLADAGMLYYTGYKSLRFAITAQNFGFETKYIGATFKNPITVRMGMAMDFWGGDNPNKLTAIVEALHPSDYSERLNLGLEYSYNNILFLRGGYKFNYNEQSYTLGLGLNWNIEGIQTQVDFSYAYFGVLGNVLRYTLQTSF